MARVTLDYFRKDKPWLRKLVGRCDYCGKLSVRTAVGLTQGDLSVTLYLCDECFRKFLKDLGFQARAVRKKVMDDG